ncbi:MAG: hypothetical protein QMD07_07810 [Thermodesulfovibrionales bacterium]|nr:hypothetical protein [Thermodesulfovibrionales bacterium]
MELIHPLEKNGKKFYLGVEKFTMDTRRDRDKDMDDAKGKDKKDDKDKDKKEDKEAKE